MRAAQLNAIKNMERSNLAWGRANGFIDFVNGKWWTLNMSGGLAEQVSRRDAAEIAGCARHDVIQKAPLDGETDG